MSRHSALRLPQNRGPAAWNTILGPQPEARKLDGNLTADFAIVGGGFAGLSAARRLTRLQPKARIVLLDAGSIAEGAAGRNSGFMIDLPHELTSKDYSGAGDDKALIALNRQAIAFGRAAVEDYGISADYFDPCGKVNGAAGAKAQMHNESYARHLGTLGEAFETLDAGQMKELTGSRHYISGLYTPGTVVLQPAGYVRGLAKGLSGTVDIFENAPVTQIAQCGPDWRITANGGTVTAPRVILATNGHLESFGFGRGHLMQVILFASMTPELDAGQLDRLGGAPRWGITPSDPMGTTVRRIDRAQGGNRIVTRTFARLRPGMVATEADMRRAAAMQQRKFDQRFPQLAGMAMAFAWAGHLCLSLNGVSVTREIDDGLFSACVQNGLGTVRGTLSGIAAAELACGEESEITRYFAGQEPPRRLPPRPFREIGANAVMRWREWQARDE